MQAADLLDRLNTLDEHERIEAKRGTDAGKSILETVCAFANEPGLGGGCILLGVQREELSLFPSYTVVGVPKPDQLAADLATQCRSAFNVPVRVEIGTEILDAKPVLVVRVPEAPAHEKPVFLSATGLPRGAFRRIGSTDQRCTDDDMAVLFRGREQESHDAAIVPDATIDDLSPEAIADYRAARAEANPEAEELRWGDRELLQALGAIRRRSAADEWRPTVAGLVLFGTRQALRRCLPTTRVDYIRVPGREWVPDPERRFDTIELRDPLFSLIRRAQAAILDDLPMAFALVEGALQRTETPAVPQRVIREAIVNAVMHRSYREHGPVQIIRYANRLEIRNPGFSLKSPEHLGEPGSEPRNPRIAAALHETRFAETKGSGIRVMREMMAQAGLTPPVFDSDRSRNQFTARYLFHHFLGDEDVRWLAHFRDLQLTAEEAKALVFVREAGAIDNATYRELNRVDPLTASQALRRLRKADLLDAQGGGAATYYVPGARLRAAGGAVPLPASGSPASSGPLRLLSGESDSLSGELPALSGESNPPDKATSPEPDAARRALLAPLPGDVAALVGALGARSRPEQVTGVLRTLVALRPWRLEELATLLRRNAEYIRHEYLKPLLDAGEVAMLHPDEPTHPEQAYRAPPVA